MSASGGGKSRGTPPGRNRAGQGRSGASRGKGGQQPGAQRAAAQRSTQRVAATPTVGGADVHDPDGVRLQKVLAKAGLGSRRACEELIAAGRVEVDGHLVTELGVRIDPLHSAVRVDGLRVQLDESLVYLALNKPRGVVSTMSDPQGRPCLGDLLANREDRLFHVGRLDAETEGLILLTNDGELANRLAHPSYQVLKTYLAEVEGSPARSVGARLKAGIELDDGPVEVDKFRLVDAGPGRALVEVVLHEGRKHVVRRLLAAVDCPVIQLVRTQIGPIHLGDLRPGRTRVLGRPEVGALMALVDM